MTSVEIKYTDEYCLETINEGETRFEIIGTKQIILVALFFKNDISFKQPLSLIMFIQ